MAVRTLATFKAAFPDDAEWDERGLPLVPGGNTLTTAIREGLERVGVHCGSVTQHSFYGWKFDFEMEGAKSMCIVQSFEEDQWLLIYKRQRWLLSGIFSRNFDDRIAATVRKIHQVLTSEPQFSQVKWHYQGESEKGESRGSETPI